MKDYWFNQLDEDFFGWDCEYDEELPPVPENKEEEKETFKKHENHDIVKNEVRPYGKAITFYYCRDCKIEVTKE